MEKSNSVFTLSTNRTLLLLTLLFPLLGFSQFPGAVGQSNTNAIEKDSSIIVGWANNCSVERGWMNIEDHTLGKSNFGTENDATGPADQSNVVSLGDSGYAILTFAHPIFNGTGPDFVVFENSFNDSFLELGHVEVSSDGINYFRFPSDFLSQNTIQIGTFGEMGEAEKINNLAGKYRGGFGTPFDLEELNGIAGLDLNAITHIKVIDVVGSIDPNNGSMDKNGNLINDPFPTPFGSSGFDLDAIGACYMQSVNSLQEIDNSLVHLYPNPVESELSIQVNSSTVNAIEIYSSLGKVVKHSTETTINVESLSPGIYHVKVSLANGQQISKRIIKR